MFRVLLLLTFVSSLSISAAASSKIDPELEKTLRTSGIANVVVSFTENTDQILQRIKSTKYDTRGARITSLKEQLEELRDSSQENAFNLLNRSTVQYKSMWINNRIYIRNANADLIRALADLPQVAKIRGEAVVYLHDNPMHVTAVNISVNRSFLPEWGIEKIEAPQAWALGNNGTGVVVANIDTGVRHTHEALKNNYRSSYGWFDPEIGTLTPADPIGHGTHNMGIIVGSNGIGVAPGAQWIACRGCAIGTCMESNFIACGQWVICPTLSNGESPNCDMAPSLVSNSWGGNQGSTWFNGVINAWHVAGIVPFFSLGNAGPSCGTALSPADNVDVIGVGCTTPTDEVCNYSSRGPTLSGAIKPDISAPGSSIRSAWHISDNAYNTISGSMSAPHVAGTAALLFAHNPNFSFTQIKQLIYDNAEQQLGSAPSCGNIPPEIFPNNIYGYGRVNARRALEAAINLVPVS